MSFDALSDLVDTALDADEVAAIRKTLADTPGVVGLHELRTRKMGDQALVDAHVLVDPRISVSEGHYIAETARRRVLEHHDVIDVMVHIDPEDDLSAKPSTHLPDRATLLAYLRTHLEHMPNPESVVLHYLDGGVEAELNFPCDVLGPAGIDALNHRLDNLMRDDPYFRRVQAHIC